jgi:hypothetical protein
MADADTTKMNLQHDITVNGRTFKAGQNVEVPKAQADDIARIDYDNTKLEQSYNKKQVYEKNAGSFAVGSGAE